MKSKKQEKADNRPHYEKPVIKEVYQEEDFVTKELPFVGATSVYKTYVPARVILQV